MPNKKPSIANYTGYDIAFLNKEGKYDVVYASQGVVEYTIEATSSLSTSELEEITGGLPVLFERSWFFYLDNHGRFHNGLPHTGPSHYIVVNEDVAKHANHHKLYRGIVFPRKFEINDNGLMLISELGTFYHSVEKK